jgi:hypothetical protein
MTGRLFASPRVQGVGATFVALATVGNIALALAERNWFAAAGWVVAGMWFALVLVDSRLLDGMHETNRELLDHSGKVLKSNADMLRLVYGVDPTRCASCGAVRPVGVPITEPTSAFYCSGDCFLTSLAGGAT